MKSEDIKKQDIDTLLPQVRINGNGAADTKPPPVFFSKRLVVAVLSFFCFFMVAIGGQVINISVIEMVPRNHSSSSTENVSTSHTLLFESTRYQWDTMTIGIVLNMFWYGCLFSPIGGVLAQTFGGATIVGITMLLVGVILIFTPTSLYIHFYLFLASRGLVGLLEGFSVTSFSPIFVRWIPKHERPTFVSFIVNGFYCGNAATFILCGFLAHHFGWPMAFYSSGVICLCWSLLWLLLVTNDPSEDKRISQKELAFIKQGTEIVSSSQNNNDHPYAAISSSPPFWALILCKFAYGWTTGFVVGYCPTYIKDMTHNNTTIVGYLSSIPNLANIIIIPTGGILLNSAQKRSKLSDNQIHKLVIGIGFIICSGLFTLITIANNFIVSMVCTVSINVLISFTKIVYELITVDMAPNHTSLISGMSMFGQTCGVIVSQTFVGYMIQNHSLEEWNKCFLWSTGILLFVTLVYLIYGSSEPQPWSMLSQSHGSSQDLRTRKDIPMKKRDDDAILFQDPSGYSKQHT